MNDKLCRVESVGCMKRVMLGTVCVGDYYPEFVNEAHAVVEKYNAAAEAWAAERVKKAKEEVREECARARLELRLKKKGKK